MFDLTQNRVDLVFSPIISDLVPKQPHSKLLAKDVAVQNVTRSGALDDREG